MKILLLHRTQVIQKIATLFLAQSIARIVTTEGFYRIALIVWIAHRFTSANFATNALTSRIPIIVSSSHSVRVALIATFQTTWSVAIHAFSARTCSVKNMRFLMNQ
jgi:hypothetical protein